MDRGIIGLILVGALVLVAAFQTFQLITISNAIGSANLGVQTAAGNPTTSSAPVKTITAPSGGGGDLDNLPSMVGGC